MRAKKLRLGNPDTDIGPWIILGRVPGRVDSVSEFLGQLDAAKSAPTAARFVSPTMNPIIMEPYHHEGNTRIFAQVGY
jgi:hypothetical protein